ncbi:MAG TPA: SOS response-associated peptidase [Rhizomicrobium sp.]|nr:SOS response-associated peptidase [Rhizomicrobium sp.]
MCSRICLSTDIGKISSSFGLSESKVRLKPHWNINAGHLLPVIRLDPLLQGRRLDLMRWGLIPASAQNAVIVRSHLSVWEIDGRLNDALNYRARRCLVPVDNFYEWRPADGQPFAVAMADRHFMTIAGIWDIWISPLAERIACFALLTTAPNGLLAPLGKQMPVIIQPEDWNLWLGTHSSQERTLQDLLRPLPDSLLCAWAVSRRVRSIRNDDPDILAAMQG